MEELSEEKSGGNATIRHGGMISNANPKRTDMVLAMIASGDVVGLAVDIANAHERMCQEAHARSEASAHIRALEETVSFLKAELEFRRAELFERERKIAELRMELVMTTRAMM